MQHAEIVVVAAAVGSVVILCGSAVSFWMHVLCVGSAWTSQTSVCNFNHRQNEVIKKDVCVCATTRKQRLVVVVVI